MLLYIRTLTGTIISLDCDTDDYIYDVKLKIQEKEGIPVREQVLIFAGQELWNSRRLSEYSIVNVTTLHLVRRSGNVKISTSASRDDKLHKEETMTKRERRLQQELNELKHTMQAKDQKIVKLGDELQAAQTKLVSVTDELEQQQKLLVGEQQKIGYLQGVEVFRETVLEVVGDKSQKQEWSGYGIYIEVPDGALPPQVTSKVTIKLVVAGQFQFPKHHRVISAIYWIFSSEAFLKEVAIYIQHCAIIRSDQDCSSFKFAIAKCSQKELPYRFKERDGVFSPHTQFATIRLKQFSFVTASAPDDVETRYSTLHFYRPMFGCDSFDYKFIVVRNLEADLQHVKTEQEHWKLLDELSRIICFKDSEITLNIPDTYPATAAMGQWKILPLTHPVISKEEVDSYKPKLTIPSCTVQIKWTGDGNPSDLCCKVTLSGTKSEAYFYIRYFPQATGQEPVERVSGPTSPTSSTNLGDILALSELLCLKYNNGTQRLFVVEEMAGEWKTVGILLQFTEANIKVIASSSSDQKACCLELLSQWLQGFSGDPRPKSWNTLLEVLKDAHLIQLGRKLENIVTKGTL